MKPAGAHLALPLREAPDPDESRLLLERALSGPSEDTAHRRRSERRLDPGDTVGVLGRLSEHDGRLIVDTRAVFMDRTYERDLRQTVVRNGPLAAIAIGAGATIMAVTAGII